MDRDEIWRLAEAQRAFTIASRRHIHRNPELSFQEHETAAFIAERLREMGYEPRTGIGSSGTGLIAELVGGRPGAAIALRADIDALPVEEVNDLDYRSARPGAMHACGHDGHTAMLLGTARAMAAVRDHIPGRVVFLFQHAEELPPGGALDLIEAGALDGVDAVFGLHQSPQLDIGQMSFGAGPRQASTDSFTLSVLGKGGHGAMPDTTIDAVQIGAQVVTALHQIVSRRVSPLEPAVITIGTFHAGTKENIIAHEATITATVRTLDPEVRDRIPREVEAVARGVTGAWGAEYRLDYRRGYPVLVNDSGMTAVARRAAEAVLGPEAVFTQSRPIMPAEDFAYYLQQVPGSFASVGGGTPGTSGRGATHSGAFRLDDAGLTTGVAYYLSLVTNFEALRAQSGEPA